MLTYFLFAIGFVILIKGADWLVDGSSSLAKKFKIPVIVIGLTIVAFGTSAPELVVNLFASAQGQTEIAIGNVLGSNIANILLILGISAIIFPLSVKKNTTWKEIPLSLLAALVVGILANDMLIDGNENSAISRADGLILISFFIIFLAYIIGIAKEGFFERKMEVKEFKTSRSVIYILLGLIGLALGGKWIVDGAVEIATAFGVSQSLIGLTIIAIGTSLPELATSAVAAWKKNPDIAVGNVVGSNIFNLFWVLGVSSIIRPLPFRPEMTLDVAMVILASLALFAFIFIGKKQFLERWQGVFFVLTFIAYIIFLVIRG
ncbi:MAG: calcium/sodium antiporter [Patescibacteria group bacterium]